MREFIKRNKKVIDEYIRDRCGKSVSLNNEDRRQWILNDEALYRWARSEGVRI